MNALSILQIFELSFGLKINLSKSGLAGINIVSQELSNTTSSVGCQILEWPLVYLGVPLGGNPRSVSFWDPVVEKISKLFGNWKGAYFSLGNQITLIKACLSSIPLYYLSLFCIPVGIVVNSAL